MTVFTRCSVAAALGALFVVVGPVPATAEKAAVVVPVATIEAVQGALVRWSVPGTQTCGMGKQSWAALQETCYYPVDLMRGPGPMSVSRQGAGPAEYAEILVGAASRGTQDIKLGDIPQAKPSLKDLERNTRDQKLVAKVWARREGPARFTLPLGAPATPLPEATGFGAKWTFDDDPDATEFHSGADYALASGTPLVSLADGTVVIAADLFYAGNAVFIDHGNALVSMYFHLSELNVKAGQEVKKGESLGLVGSTGRATGPHFHMAIRWHDARIDPEALLGDPAKIPAFPGSPASAGAQ